MESWRVSAGTGAQTFWFCPGCRKGEGGEGGAGHYCLSKSRNCYAKHHLKLRRTCAENKDDNEVNL